MSNVMLENVRIWWPKLDKPRPSRYAGKPASWSLQIRTTDLNELKKWRAALLKPKSHVPDDKDPDSYFYINLYKKNEGKDGEKKGPPNVVDRRGHPMNPSIVGNNSLANISLFGYEHPTETGTTTSFVLMGVQVLELVKYIGTTKPEFKDLGGETPIIGTSGGDPESETEHDFVDMEDDIPFEEEPATAPLNKVVKTVTGDVLPRAPSTIPKIKPDAGDEF